MNILGIDIDESSRDEIHARVDGFLRGNRFRRIATVNSEFLVEADRNPPFHDALSAADFRVTDGIGIVLAGLFRGRRITRYPGADLLLHILAKAEEENVPIFLAVRKDGLSAYKEIRQAILVHYPKIHVFGRDIRIGEIGNWKLEIGNSAIVLCNFGAPEQEYFLEGLRKEGIPSRLGMGVGGAFDFLTGKRRRAPVWMRAIGFEWLWRLVHEPRRARRIWNATVVFLWKILLEKKKTTH